jgi:penicillin-binding protein 2
VIDELNQKGRRLRIIAGGMAAGLVLLLGGLWFVQIVDGRHFANNLQRQSFRTVGIPAIRGKILDCRGRVLATDRPRYNASLFLEDLQEQFNERFTNLAAAYTRAHPEVINKRGRVVWPVGARRALQLQADCDVVSNITYRVSASLDEPRLLNPGAFMRHYTNFPYVPFQIVPDLAPRQMAIFAEQLSSQPDMELETQPVRIYPNGGVAAHLLGFVQRVDSVDAAGSSDFEGRSGVERVFDVLLRGQAGIKSVLVNNQNYRQREEVVTPNLPGNDIYLTINLAVQRAAEAALASAQANTRGAVVVLDPRNGDVLALASAPAFDPNSFVTGFGQAENARLNDPKFRPQLNRAVTGAYPPASTFKIITALACLENGLDPREIFDSPGEYRPPGWPNARAMADTAGPGPFNFERAFYRSSNTYFIHYGLQAGLQKILEVARRFHLGVKTAIETGQEVSGNIPSADKVGHSFPLSSGADVCIGQEIGVTPLQMAGMIEVIANGGTLYWPRESGHARNPDTGEVTELVEQGRMRDHVKIDPQHLEIIRHAMLEDTEFPGDRTTKGGTAYEAFHSGSEPYLGSFRVAGKTGTAQVKSPNSPYQHITWFDSYGPYEDPRYVVVVMVEDGAGGGTTCAPVARKIYEAILKEEQGLAPKAQTVAGN